MDLIFFIRGNNDIDHMVPIIYHSCLRENKVSIISTKLENTFEQDRRIQYLTETFKIELLNISDFMELNIFTQKLVKINQMSNFKKTKKRLLNRLISQSIKYLIKDRHYNRIPKNLLKQTINKSARFIFDHQVGALQKKIISYAKRKNINSIAIPHAIDNWAGSIYENNDINIEKTITSFNDYNIYKKVLFTNEHEAIKAQANGLNKKNIRILGSARFSKSWLDIQNNEIKTENVPLNVNDGLKIVYFMTKPKNGIFVDEVERCIDMISKFDDIQLVLQPHTRGMDYKSSAAKVYVDNNNIPFYKWIDWADLILFSATSVIIDAIIKRKPVLFLRRTVASKLVFEEYFDNWVVDSRDELKDWIYLFLSNKHAKTYNEKEAKRFLKEIIGYNKDVLENYYQEIKAN